MTPHKKLRIYLPFAKSEIQRAMAYRMRFFVWMLAGYVYIVASYFLWKAIYNSTGGGLISGFTFREMAVYILLVYAVDQMTGSPAGWIIGSGVQNGSIAMMLIKPINYSVSIFFSALGGNLFSAVVAAGPLFLTIGILFHDITGPAQVGLFAASVFLSFCVRHFFDMCFSMISFYTTYVWGLQMLKLSLLRFLSGALIPFALFPEGARRVFELLPFAGLGYTPVMIFLGKYTGRALPLFLGLQLFWALFFWGLSKLLWRWAVRRLTILGG
jgi:ABC-2 type transport system permease protein